MSEFTRGEFHKRESSKIARSQSRKGITQTFLVYWSPAYNCLDTTIKLLSKPWPAKADSPTELCSSNTPNLNGTIQLYQQYVTHCIYTKTCVKEVRSSCHKRFPMEIIRLSTLEMSMAVHQSEVTARGLGQNAAFSSAAVQGDSPASVPRKTHLMDCLLHLGAGMPIPSCWQKHKACESSMNSSSTWSLRGALRPPSLGVGSWSRQLFSFISE